jgi:hypothetical protein
VKQNWRLISANFFYNLIWYYHTLYPDTSIILIIALLSFVDHDGIANCGCHTETCSHNYTMYKNNVLICISADGNYRLGGTRLHSEELNLDSDRLSMEGPYESATYVDGLDWRLHKSSEWHKGCSQLII